MTELAVPAADLAAPSADARYGLITARFTALGERLRGLGEQVQASTTHVEGYAASVGRLAEHMAELNVDGETVAEHHEAATVMRAVREAAHAEASAANDLSTRFTQVADDHRADYGTVVEAERAMPVPMANASFYANR